MDINARNKSALLSKVLKNVLIASIRAPLVEPPSIIAYLAWTALFSQETNATNARRVHSNRRENANLATKVVLLVKELKLAALNARPVNI